MVESETQTVEIEIEQPEISALESIENELGEIEFFDGQDLSFLF